jgi:hypothetical protein
VRDENKKRTSSQWGSRVGAAQSKIMMMPANSPWMSERARGVARRAGHDRHEVRLRHGALRRPTVHLDGVATRSCITYIESIGTFVLRESDGSIDTMAGEHRAGRIVAIYLIRNPDKLQHVGADFAAMEEKAAVGRQPAGVTLISSTQ